MRVLALDTALDACATAVLDSERRDLVASETQPMARGHAEALMPMVARVMDAARLEFSDIDRIAVTIGPGSFTGVRVGIAAARGIALAAGKPAIGLTTLAAFTAPHVAAGFAGTVVPVIDARHGQVYMQVFSPGGRAAIAPRLAPLREAVEAARTRAPALITGSAADLVAAQWPADEPAPKVVAARAPEIGWVARLGAAAQEERAIPKPLYLRPPDARPQDAARIAQR
jgi:tRNA threonylcarbamoyl adenosine modification protein YeaZ